MDERNRAEDLQHETLHGVDDEAELIDGVD
jgi:hypothetical protein